MSVDEAQNRREREARIKLLRDGGATFAQIAASVGCSYSMVQRALRSKIGAAPAAVRPPAPAMEGLDRVSAAVLVEGRTYRGRAALALRFNMSESAILAIWHKVRGQG